MQTGSANSTSCNDGVTSSGRDNASRKASSSGESCTTEVAIGRGEASPESSSPPGPDCDRRGRCDARPGVPAGTLPLRTAVRRSRSWSGGRRRRSARSMRYWSRTSSSGCWAMTTNAAVAALERPSAVVASSPANTLSTLNRKKGTASLTAVRSASGSLRARSPGSVPTGRAATATSSP